MTKVKIISMHGNDTDVDFESNVNEFLKTIDKPIDIQYQVCNNMKSVMIVYR